MIRCSLILQSLIGLDVKTCPKKNMAFLRTAASLALLFLALVNSAMGSVDPYEPGEFQVNATTILRIEAIQLDHNLRVFAPNEPGTFKVIYFIGGLEGKSIPYLRNFH